MFNPQANAVAIEMTLRNKNRAKMQDADFIRNDPLGYLDEVLAVYEKESEENEMRGADFWDKYEHLKGIKLDEWGEEQADQLVKDVRALFE